MLFQSVEFIFLFLPVTWIIFFVLLYLNKKDLLIVFVAAASLYFYGYYFPAYTLLILGSVGINFFVGRILSNHRTKAVLAAGIVFNLVLLGSFKYTGFIFENVALISNHALNVPNIVLPLAISFFTFQQIAYLIDVYRNPGPGYRAHEYALFVLFFPQLVAGPIVHHFEILPQVKRWRFRYRKVCLDLALGLSIFAIGLSKKLLIADNIGTIAEDVFAAAGPSNVPVFYDCWYGALAFSLQIYFDFSAYSDMAIGLARMFGIVLPLNFNSPYKAASIIDFWRRWHMTLSRFLRDYLYVPLGGGRHGVAVKYRNILIVMLLGGLWHGAGWGFVVWGALHGIYLIINHAWRAVAAPLTKLPGYRFAGWCLTFLAVTIAWVPFRAPDIQTTWAIYQEMTGLSGLNLGYSRYLSWGADAFFGNLGMMITPSRIVFDNRMWLAFALPVVFLAPNIYEWTARFSPALGNEMVPLRTPWAWQANAVVGAILGIIACVALLSSARTVEFLYFQF